MPRTDDVGDRHRHHDKNVISFSRSCTVLPNCGVYFMKDRPPKSRPSNVIVYVALGIVSLIGLFLFGQTLESFDSESPRSHPAIAVNRT